MPETKLGYMKVATLAPGAFAGGLMVVDPRGLPVDFRYTDPVRPSSVQQILYGRSLDKHVRQDVIFKHLTEKMETRPAMLLVDDEVLLPLPSSVPVVLVLETRLAPLKEQGARQAISETEHLLQVGESGSPVRFRLPAPDPAGVEKAAEVLLEAGRQGLDPVEPFGRIEAALEALCRDSSDED